MTRRWCWINLPYATFGLLIEKRGLDYIVVEAPPIARWTIGKHWRQVSRWVDSKGGEFEWLTAGT